MKSHNLGVATSPTSFGTSDVALLSDQELETAPVVMTERGSAVLDERARRIALALSSQKITSKEGMDRLGMLCLQAPEVASMLATKHLSKHGTVNDTIADELADEASNTVFRRLTQKSLRLDHSDDEAEGEPQSARLSKDFVDPIKFLDSSFSGWIFTTTKSVMRSSSRNVWRRTSQIYESYEPDVLSAVSDGVDRASTRLHHLDPASLRDEIEERSQAASGWISSQSRHMRGVRADANRSAGIRYSLGLPAMCRPDWDERLRLSATGISAQAAYLSAQEALRIREGETRRHEIPDGLVSLWDNYDWNDLSAVAKLPAEVAGALVSSAVSDRPRHRLTVAALKKSIRERGDGPGWRSMSAELTELALACDFESFSPFNSRSAAGEEEQRRQGREATYARRMTTLRACLGLDESGMPTMDVRFRHNLGRTPEAIMETLMEIVEEVADPISEVSSWAASEEA